MAGGAGIAQPSLAVAARAGEVELHGAGHLVDVAGAIAFRAHRGSAARPRPVPWQVSQISWRVDIERDLGAADGLPEIDVHSVFEVGAFFGAAGSAAFAPLPAEELGEDIAERASAASRLRTGPAAVVHVIGKIEAAEIHAGLHRLSNRLGPAPGPPGGMLSE